jgi:uncharacterized membrane protein (UPF0127 family)
MIGSGCFTNGAVVRIVSGTTGKILADRARTRSSFTGRLIGLLGTGSLPAGGGAVIHPCSSIHSLFMRYPIDVAFIDRTGVVLRAFASLPPYRFARAAGSTTALELPAGALASARCAEGDELSLSRVG